jgi:hypothetical protein
LLHRRIARFLELLPVRCVLKRRIVLPQRLLDLALGFEYFAPSLQRIGPVRAFQVSPLELRRRAFKIPVAGQRNAPPVVARSSSPSMLAYLKREYSGMM